MRAHAYMGPIAPNDGGGGDAGVLGGGDAGGGPPPRSSAIVGALPDARVIVGDGTTGVGCAGAPSVVDIGRSGQSAGCPARPPRTLLFTAMSDVRRALHARRSAR
jgi:hypothetical protein